MQFVILTGMSGSGKHTAFKFLEDFGYYCVDNLPVQLLQSLVELAEKNQSNTRVAVGIDIRSGDSIHLLRDVLSEMDEYGRKYSIIFMDAEDEILLKRYKETRRNHPLAGDDRLETGFARERQQLAFLREHADYVIDTSHLITRELRAELQKILLENSEDKKLFVTVLSFGFKYGVPADADLVFDVRFLPNPYYVSELRHLTGEDEKIRHFVMDNDVAKEFLERLSGMVEFLIPQYISEGKTQLVIAVGCTGGKHRSVTIANELFDRLPKDEGYGLRIEHRDIGK